MPTHKNTGRNTPRPTREDKPTDPGSVIRRIVRFLGLSARALLQLIVVLFFVLPFLWMIFGGVRPASDLFSHLYPLQWHTIVPSVWTLDNFGELFAMGFGRSFLNSIIVAAFSVPLALLLDSMAAFAFVWLRLPGRRLIFGMLMVMLIIPKESILIPMYLVVTSFHMQNTLAALVVPWLAHVFGIFFFRQFLLDLPQEIADAAAIDGASPFQTYWRVMLPNLKPAIVTVALVYFMWSWNAFLWPLIAIQDQKRQVVQVAAATFIDPDFTDWSLIFAANTLAALPVILLFLWLQRYYIQGVARTGLHG
ncbi:MAG: carbohydrate ABC transporter permease [Chloroflexota bacterium]|nr:carbohydrate ABC transporter permease [Chloroflexota bacterium]